MSFSYVIRGAYYLLNLNKVLKTGICVVEGYIEACGETITVGNMLISKENDSCDIVIGENTRLLLFGGKPYEEERFVEWNFVSSSKEKIEEAKRKWTNKEFKIVPNEIDYVPLPKPILDRME